jgi:hypothetical protein
LHGSVDRRDEGIGTVNEEALPWLSSGFAKRNPKKIRPVKRCMRVPEVFCTDFLRTHAPVDAQCKRKND